MKFLKSDEMVRLSSGGRSAEETQHMFRMFPLPREQRYHQQLLLRVAVSAVTCCCGRRRRFGQSSGLLPHFLCQSS